LYVSLCLYLYGTKTQTLKQNKMETTMKLAIETYANLTNRTFNQVAKEMQTSKLIQDSIMKLMFSVA
jgi:hypothetical protein